MQKVSMRYTPCRPIHVHKTHRATVGHRDLWMFLFTHAEYASANDVLFSVLVSQRGTIPNPPLGVQTWSPVGWYKQNGNKGYYMYISHWVPKSPLQTSSIAIWVRLTLNACWFKPLGGSTWFDLRGRYHCTICKVKCYHLTLKWLWMVFGKP